MKIRIIINDKDKKQIFTIQIFLHIRNSLNFLTYQSFIRYLLQDSFASFFMMYTLNCNGRLLVIDQPLIMGILNATPDSFYTQGVNFSVAGMLSMAERMVVEGATILDIGGLSARPGSQAISASEELQRVIPIIKAVRAAFPGVFLSIDTYRATVAKAAIEEGVDMVNDISAGQLDADMIPLVASKSVPYIAMHMQGRPENMQQSPQYNDVGVDVLQFCIKAIDKCRQAGIKDVIIDPGFGFGKTISQNYQLLQALHTFAMLDVPLLVGVSRKSMIYSLLDTTAEDALVGTAIVNNWALEQGAHILRVHDVKEAQQVIKLRQAYLAAR